MSSQPAIRLGPAVTTLDQPIRSVNPNQYPRGGLRSFKKPLEILHPAPATLPSRFASRIRLRFRVSDQRTDHRCLTFLPSPPCTTRSATGWLGDGCSGYCKLARRQLGLRSTPVTSA